MSEIKNQIQLPLEIANGSDDIMLFRKYYTDKLGRTAVEVENKIPTKVGPPMHVHYLQDESLTVVSGTMGIKEPGKPEKFITAGETIIWKAGVPHKFWNACNEILHCTGWVAPVDNFVYLLSEIHKSINAGGGKPSLWDIAFLMRKYKTEFYMLEIPAIVQATVFPIIIFVGKLLGKYRKYAFAPKASQF